MLEESKFEMTQWCNEHDLPMRTVRTADDRIVCWFIWWMDAMDRRPPGVSLEEISVPILPCDPSFRVVLAQGFVSDGPIE